MSTQATGELAETVGQQLMETFRILQKTKTRLNALMPHALDHAAFPIIARLVVGGPARASTLADCLHSDVSTISRQTSALVHAGLIERRADPDDGRACLLAPTPKGEELYERVRELRNKWFAETLGDWKPDDIARLTDLLGRLNADLSATAVSAHATEGN